MDNIDILHERGVLRELYPEIDDRFFDWLCDNGYFTAPASTKYHGNHEGGLFEHSVAVATTLRDLTKDNWLHWMRDSSPVIIGLFHDICKIDQYRHPEKTLMVDNVPQSFPDQTAWEYSDDMLLKGHGDKSIMILASHMQLTEEEVMCIRYHMGAFTPESEWKDYTRAVRRYPNVLWTHQADMIAAHIMGT